MKVTFSRFITFIVIVEMTALLPVSIITMHYPPNVFMICWTVFWCLVEVLNMKMKKVHNKRDRSDSFINKIIEMVKDKDIDNEDILNFIKEVKGIISD